MEDDKRIGGGGAESAEECVVKWRLLLQLLGGSSLGSSLTCRPCSAHLLSNLGEHRYTSSHHQIKLDTNHVKFLRRLTDRYVLSPHYSSPPKLLEIPNHINHARRDRRKSCECHLGEIQPARRAKDTLVDYLNVLMGEVARLDGYSFEALGAGDCGASALRLQGVCGGVGGDLAG